IVTGDDGGFTIQGVGSQSLVIAADHPTDGRSNVARLPAGPQSTTINPVLRPFAPLDGTVTSGGKPLSHAIVLAAQQTAAKGNFMVQTGDDGAYRFDKLAPDTYMVSAMEPSMMGGRNMFTRLVTVTDQGGHLDIDLPAAGVTVTVGITPPSGTPVNTAQVFLISGTVSVKNADQLTDAIAERGEGSLHPGFVLHGTPVK